ncbi:MAG: argininosuccinate lyase [Planctomycetes bacterium]|nr:argininosuccinate lyase [Planctomycetota bacterium]
MSAQSGRLWETGAALDELVHRFTVGDDPTWDGHLVHWDCLGSAAHARTLARAELLSQAELDALLAGLADIDRRARAGDFAIPEALEDCHTAIEAALTKRCGQAGAKIHAGRSRNDQVATAMRLFMRHHALRWLDLLDAFVAAVTGRIRCDGHIAMPGYTHLRPAMPSRVGQWLHAIAEAGLEQMRAACDLLERLDACPLGTGAGFGVPLPLDRAHSAELLGFSRVQRSALDVQNSRGRLEKYFVRAAVDVAAVLEKMSCDLILFTAAEFGFFGLPEAMTTGSSIMPQKKNPDVLELLRGRSARLRARLFELEWVTGKLPSSYHRDLQLTKEPTIRIALELPELLEVATRVAAGFTINAERLAAAMGPELYATHAALELVQRGVPFREAYRRVAEEIKAGRFDDGAAERWRRSTERFDPAILAALEDERAAWRRETKRYRVRTAAAEAELLPGNH